MSKQLTHSQKYKLQVAQKKQQLELDNAIKQAVIFEKLVDRVSEIKSGVERLVDEFMELDLSGVREKKLGEIIIKIDLIKEDFSRIVA